MTDEQVDQMIEDVKSIRNDCEIILLLYGHLREREIRHLYPTALENMGVKAQELMLEYCIKLEGVSKS